MSAAALAAALVVSYCILVSVSGICYWTLEFDRERRRFVSFLRSHLVLTFVCSFFHLFSSAVSVFELLKSYLVPTLVVSSFVLVSKVPSLIYYISLSQ